MVRTKNIRNEDKEGFYLNPEIYQFFDKKVLIMCMEYQNLNLH